MLVLCGLVALVIAGIFWQMPPTGATVRTSSVKSKLLTISEMPAGWRIDNSSSGGDGLAGNRCLAGLAKANGDAGQAQVFFEDGGGVPFVAEIIGSGKKQSDDFSAINKGLAGCKTLKLKSSGGAVSGTIGALSLPPIGTKSSAYLITFASNGVMAGLDLIVFSVGRYVGALIYGTSGTPDVAQVEAFAALAVAKLTGAPLPPVPSTTTTLPASVA